MNLCILTQVLFQGIIIQSPCQKFVIGVFWLVIYWFLISICDAKKKDTLSKVSLLLYISKKYGYSLGMLFSADILFLFSNTTNSASNCRLLLLGILLIFISIYFIRLFSIIVFHYSAAKMKQFLTKTKNKKKINN